MFFDKEGMFRLDEMILESPTFKKIMEDGIITDEEVKEQSERVLVLYKDMEAQFTEEQRKKIAETIIETAVLYAVTKQKELQEYHH